jgi:flagellin-specific chaperone FliS
MESKTDKSLSQDEIERQKVAKKKEKISKQDWVITDLDSVLNGNPFTVSKAN